MFKNFIFDFGNVLMDWNPDYVYGDFFQTCEEMAEFYRETDIKTLNLEFDRGLAMDEGLSTAIKNHPKHEVLLRMWKTHWHLMLKGKITQNVDFALRLKEKGFGLYGLTNWSAETFPYALDNYDFFDAFDDIVVSGQVRLIKPDPRIYRLLLEKNALVPGECVFFDDNLSNIETAKNLGIHGIHVTGIEQDLEKELENAVFQ